MYSILPPPASSVYTQNPNQMQNQMQNPFHAPVVSSPLSSSPLRSSPTPPLSPRNSNIQPHSPTPSSRQRNAQSASSPIFSAQNSSPFSKRESPFAKRPVKRNPLIHGRDESREARRSVFLKRVRQSSEDKRWEMRGGDEEMMRALWVSEERRRRERIRMEAEAEDNTLGALEEDDLEDTVPMELPQGTRMDGMRSRDEVMADQVAMQEQAELDALLASMEQDSTQGQSRKDYPESVYGSDDDEYDNLFMNVIREESMSSSQPAFSSQALPFGSSQTLPYGYDHDMMDTS